MGYRLGYHVTVLKTGADKRTLQIHKTVGVLCNCFLVASGEEKAAVFYAESFLQRQGAGVDGSVVINSFHKNTSLWMIVAEREGGGKEEMQ